MHVWNCNLRAAHVQNGSFSLWKVRASSLSCTWNSNNSKLFCTQISTFSNFNQMCSLEDEMQCNNDKFTDTHAQKTRVHAKHKPFSAEQCQNVVTPSFRACRGDSCFLIHTSHELRKSHMKQCTKTAIVHDITMLLIASDLCSEFPELQRLSLQQCVWCSGKILTSSQTDWQDLLSE